MADKKKKKSPAEMHRQIQDTLQVLPKYVEQQKQEGKRFKAFMLQYVSGPLMRLMNRGFNARRYRGDEGKVKQQADMMRRRLEQKQAAIRHVQTAGKNQRKGRPAK